MTATRYVLNLGTPGGGDGDPIRTAFSKIEKNFAILFGDASGQFVGKSESFAVDVAKTYLVDARTIAVTGTLPSAPELGDTVRFVDAFGSFATNNFTIGRNGKKINGVASNTVMSTNFSNITLQFINDTIGWVTL